jgi:transcription initiation factor TFIIIB Brf1 subunit/transcription initiation factor TFIIB
LANLKSGIFCIHCQSSYFSPCHYDVKYERYDKQYQSHYTDVCDITITTNQKEIPDERTKLYAYACEDCGFIMHFSKEKVIFSKSEAEKFKEEETEKREAVRKIKEKMKQKALKMALSSQNELPRKIKPKHPRY